MSKALDKEGDELLNDPPVPPAPAVPRSANQVLFINSKTLAPAGGRAAGKTRPAGSRFNKPTAEDLEHYEASKDDREQAIANDPVVRSAAGSDPLALLATVKAEVAREAAALGLQRILNEQMGRDISQVSSRRIDALKKIADIEMEMRKMGFDVLDVHSEKMQRIFKFWIETIREVAEATLTAEQLDLFFNRLTTELEDWTDKAAELVR